MGLADVLAAARVPGAPKALKVDLGGVSSWLVGAASAAGVSHLDGFRHVMDSFAVRHIGKQHGDPETEARRGRLAVDDAALRAVPDVLAQPDVIVLGARNRLGRDLLAFGRQSADATMLVLAEVRRGRRELAVQSMRVWPATMNAAAAAATLDPNAGRDGGLRLKIIARPPDEKAEAAPDVTQPTSIEVHGRLAGVFIALAELLQGVGDDGPRAEPAFLHLCMAAAKALRRLWEGGSIPSTPTELFAAAAAVAPERVTVKTAEGYAFYALYPEAYGEAARGLAPETQVIGLRSIGAGLACVAAEAIGAAPPLTVRPTGHPFARRVVLPPVDPNRTVAIVDEGPGLSGSSFGAVADALEAQGVPEGRIVFLPGHGGDLGPQASERHRRRWASARRLHVGFDALIAPRLTGWVQDLTGRVHEVEDISGGAWRRASHGADEAGWPPSAAHQERRKFRVRAEGGEFLLKFTGLGEIGLAAADRARALHEAGFGPETLGWRHGLLVQRWVQGRPLAAADRPRLLAHLPRYLAWRASAFPAQAGASPEALHAMAWTNVAEALGPDAAARVPGPPDAAPAVAGDQRLHAWEWRVADGGRLVKTDGVDHALAHDLIGPQPPAWDQAGALVEHDLAAPGLHPFWPVAYAAFQLGLWSMAADALAVWPEERTRCAAQAELYAQRLRTSL